MSSEVKYIVVNDVDVIQDFIDSLQVYDAVKVERAIGLLEEFGMKLVYSDTRNADSVTGYNNLYYLRAKYRTNTYRIFFCEYKGILVLLHAFQKKTKPIPQREIDIAERRKQSLFQN